MRSDFDGDVVGGPSPTPTEFYEAGLSDDESAPEVLKARAAQDQAEMSARLADIGVTDPPPSYDDMRLPVEYWSRRAALSDALVVFKTDGLLALGGVGISTVASVMSLYCV